MLSPQLHRRLVSLLLKVPSSSDSAGRDALMLGLPDNVATALNRNSAAYTDLNLIITQLEKLGRVGDPPEWPLLVVLDNALVQVGASDLEASLKEVRAALELQYSAEGARGPEVRPLANRSAETMDSHELATVHNFDLVEFIKPCVRTLQERESGLVIFAVPYDSPVFLEVLCERLRDEIGRDAARFTETISLNPSYRDVDFFLDTIREQYTPLLKTFDVLCAVQASSSAVAKSLCERLRAGGLEPFARRLILVLAVEPDCPLQQVVLLQRPRFDEGDVILWVGAMVRHLQWPAEAKKLWVQRIQSKCRRGDEFVIEWVYRHVRTALELLKKRPAFEDFYRQL